MKTLLALGSALLLTGVPPVAPKPDAKELDRLLRAAVESRRVPSAVAMVATRDGLVYQGAFGAPADAIFNIASMTKPVTSVALMQLVEAGKVRLDEPAHTYLPDLGGIQVLERGVLRAPKSPPTVRQLLAHTSGFTYEFLNREIAGHVKAGKLASMFESEQFLRAPLVADPGARWEYGISTDWAGKVVEAVSGQRLDAYFRAHIFEPLRMNDTFYDVPADKQRRLAQGFARQADGTLAPMPPPPPSKLYLGGSSLHSTAADYLRFARALLAGGQLDGRRILKAETVKAMGSNQLGNVPLSPIVSLNPALIVTNPVMPGSPDAFGLGFAINRRPAASG